MNGALVSSNCYLKSPLYISLLISFPNNTAFTRAEKRVQIQLQFPMHVESAFHTEAECGETNYTVCGEKSIAIMCKSGQKRQKSII